jgi:hypothetical protein
VPAGFIESLRDGPNPDGQPGVSFDVYGRPWIEPDPDDDVSEGEDVVSEENGYRWHTDGRPPEPLQD